MTDFTQFKNKSGKCSNFGNCSLADARTTVQVTTGMDFVCTECGKPLLMTGDGDSGGSSRPKNLLLVVGLLAVLLAAAIGVWVFLHGGKSTPPPPPPVVVLPVPEISAPVPPLVTGNCSDADARVGLCKKR